MEKIIGVIESRKKWLYFYSIYSFLQKTNYQKSLDRLLEVLLERYLDKSPNHHIFNVSIVESDFFFCYKHLAWDSNFFQIPVFKLDYILFEKTDANLLTVAITNFVNKVIKISPAYFFCEIPVEDVFTLQCLTKAGFKVVETRLNYYKDNISNYTAERYPVRLATINDAEKIGNVAANCRNEYDRIHADFDFNNEIADNYLRIYAENAVKGFCDQVIMPNQSNLSDEAFLAISFLKNDATVLGCKLARIVLTAVSANCKGWHQKLVSETIYIAKEKNSEYLLMTTQATNKAVIRTCEKLGFKLGSTTLILTYKN